MNTPRHWVNPGDRKGRPYGKATIQGTGAAAMDADGDDIRIAFLPRYEVCRDDTFDSPIANRRMGHRLPEAWQDRFHRPLSATGAVAAYMAGMRCPSAERLTYLVHDISGIEDWERHAVRELFAQLSPAECSEFMVTTDGSPREVARLMRECGVTRGLVVNWINQFSSDPDWHEDKALPIWWGDLWVNDGGFLRPRHG